jgi:hypothetical protein
MDVDVTFIGLCSFLNLTNTNPEMPEPSVILIRTDPAANIDQAVHKAGQLTEHLPFIAFDSAAVKVDDATGFKDLPAPNIAPIDKVNFDFPDKLENAGTFQYLPLTNAVLTIENQPAGALKVDESYGDVAKKDEYWPGTENQWNRDLVPKKTEKPSSSAVAAFMRFGGGTITAGHLSKNDWQFRDGEKVTITRKFAREVHYTFSPAGDEVVITISALDGSAASPRTLRFSPVANSGPLTIWIGNSTERGIAFATQHVSHINAGPGFGDHFAFLNQIVKLDSGSAVGPIPFEVPAASASDPVSTSPSPFTPMSASVSRRPSRSKLTEASAGAPAAGGDAALLAKATKNGGQKEGGEGGGGDEEAGYCGPQNGSGGPP